MQHRQQHMQRASGASWLTSYGDLMTILLCFFIVFFSLAKSGEEEQEKQDSPESIVERLALEKSEKSKVLETTKKQVFNAIAPIRVEVPASILFDRASTELKVSAYASLSALAKEIIALQPYKVIEIEGHSDSTPLKKGNVFINNFGLSSARAGSVAEFFMRNGIAKDKIIVKGLANTKPKLPEFDRNGTAMRENQSRNRRVEITVFKKAH